MINIKQLAQDTFLLMQYFECNDALALRCKAMYQMGLNHGKMGMFSNGDFSNFTDWTNSVGNDMKSLEESLGIEDSSVFELYDAGHAEGLTEYEKSHTWEDDSSSDDYY